MEPSKPTLVGGSKPEQRPTPAKQDATNAAPDSLAGLKPTPWVDDRQLSFVALLMLTVGAFYVAYLIFSPFLKAIFLAFVLTLAFSPLHQWITRRIRGANKAALVSTIIVMLFILVPFILISVKVAAEAASFYGYLSQQWRSGGAWYHRIDGMWEALQRAAEHTGIPVDQLKSGITARTQQFGSWLVGMAGWAARGMMQQLLTAALIFLILFFLLRDREEFRRGVANMLPLPPGRVLELTTTVHETIIANIYGMFAVGLVQGILTAIGFWMTGLPAPLLWGVMAMVFSFVPLVGPSLVWMPGALVLAMQGNMVQAFLLFLWGSIVVSAADYIIRPKVAGGRVNANRLLILLSFLGGVKAFGVIGIFVGPVILSLIVALLRILREEHAERMNARNLAA